jgi:hypothetical protein
MKFVFFPPKGIPAVNAELAALARVYRGDGLKAVKSAARTLVSQLSGYTFPQGAKGKAKMESTGIADTLRVVATPASIYTRLQKEDPKKAEQWQGIEGSGRGGKARLIAFLAGTSLAGIQLTNSPTAALVAAHRKGTRRRVRIKTPRYLATGKKGIDKIIEKKHKRIGRSAAGWAHAGKDIGGRVTIAKGKQTQQHKTRTGRAVMWRSFGKVGMTIHNDAPNIRANLPVYFEQRAIAAATLALRKQTNDAIANINARRLRQGSGAQGR